MLENECEYKCKYPEIRFRREQGVNQVEVDQVEVALKTCHPSPGVPLSSRLPSNVSQHCRLLMRIFEKCSSDQHIHFSFPP